MSFVVSLARTYKERSSEVGDNSSSCIGIYNTHTDAENGIKELQRVGFDMKKLSIVGKGYHTEEHAAGFYNTGERVKFWGKLGAFWGGLWGILFGWATFWLPGIGPLIAAGPLVSTILAGLEGAAVVGGLNAVGAALFSLGIPKDSIITYETALKAEKFLLIVHGTPDEVSRAKEILSTQPNHQVETHVA
ncbi:MAG: hypothetical protein MRJ96_06635 [Nitrospirales bacterium]|nr:DUF1269 domain-containing protein [Nitrospira sp.]MDR4501110.1 hypothetical protein [Nitrospirales bacterium]